MIDDIDFMIDMEGASSEMVHTIKDLIVKDKMIVATAKADFLTNEDVNEDFRVAFTDWKSLEVSIG